MSISGQIGSFSGIPALDPENPTSATIFIIPSSSSVKQFISNRQRTKLFELCYLLAGFPPPVNNIGMHEKGQANIPPQASNMAAPAFLFQGLERPFQEESAEDEVWVYVLNPSHTYEYKPDMACVAIRRNAPQGCCFAVYVLKNDDGQFIAVNWEWVNCDAEGRPTEHHQRYKREIQL